MKSLVEFLEEKTLYYDKIDYTIIAQAWDHLKLHITLPYVVHLVGTNGKGSTGRFMAHYLNKIGKKVLHYSSPHIMEFNERIWINGENVSNQALEKAHWELQQTLPSNLIEKLTYFEYTTLLALLLSDNFDYLVLEAGLGGEFDATNVVKNDLSLITTIDYDHQSFLGDTIEEIATTKLRSVDSVMILGAQIHEGVEKVAYDLKKEFYFKEKRTIEIKKYNFPKIDLECMEMPEYLKNNLRLAISGLKFLKFDVDCSHFEDIKLQGRCQKIAKDITVDVGHNPLAAKALLEVFKYQKVNLIYNSMKDKAYDEVLGILKPIIKTLYFIELDDQRACEAGDIKSCCESLDIQYENFEAVEKDEKYLVFGSFVTVEKFLNYYKSLNRV